MRELYIYYRVDEFNAAAARAAVTLLHESLRARHPALSARLLRRIDSTLGRETWMETYSTDPLQHADGVSNAMQSDIEAGAATLTRLIEGPRHTEVFFTCAS
jgi:Domain of unknown function (DUF4936)